jgi:RES domain-containing protein
VIVWRIAQTTPLYRAEDISGAGAAITGGRWNPKGLPMVYCSATLSLAYIETLVHLNLADPMPRNRYRIEVTIPDDIWRKRRIDTSLSPDWPADWDADPAGKGSIDHGAAWLKAVTEAVLVVPSVAIPQENNILLNPLHADFIRVTAKYLGRIEFDPRLFGIKP